MRFGRRKITYYDTEAGFEAEKFAARLLLLLMNEMRASGRRQGVFLCIGTDRSTGDSLGPLIGYKLKQERRRGTLVFGTLDRPVHAMNLEHYVQVLKNGYPDALVVAVDASVGDESHIGYVTLGRGALKPGLGVCKELHAVGDLFITGIVAGCSHYDPMMLHAIGVMIGGKKFIILLKLRKIMLLYLCRYFQH
mgnify:CR=1 FL=1